ncbi:MAG: YfhO family protein, partial [Turicibacter sp.]
EKSSFFDELKTVDDSFYRVEFNAKGFSDNNLPLASNFSGFRFYTSVFQYSQNDFLSQFKVAQWATSRVYGKENILNLLSYKYFVDFIGDANTPYGFEYFSHVQGIPVYINKYASELGFTFKETMSETEFNQKTPLEQNLLYPNYLIVPDEFAQKEVTQFNAMDSLEPILVEAQPGYYEFEFDEIKENVMIYLENFGSPNLHVVAYLDDEQVYEEEMYQFDFAGSYINVPFNKLAITVKTVNDDFGLGWLNIYLDEKLERYDPIYEDRLNESLNIIEFNNDQLRASIEIKGESKWLYTSIPYDKGWKVLVNNQEITPIKVNQGFIGLQLEPGTYELEFSFYPKGLNIGLALSLLSAVTLAIIALKNRSKKEVNEK